MEALRERAPHGEVADIDKTSREGQVVYEIFFAKPGVNSRIFVAEDGRWVASPEHLDRILEPRTLSDQASVESSD